MGNTKDLFSKGIAQKALPATSLDIIGSDIESYDYVKKSIKDKNRFIPQVDFSDPANFARYGSAEQYYIDSFNFIQTSYPYDGSKTEKVDWSLSASYLDQYIFDNVYPRTNGYVNLGMNYVPISTPYQYGYGFDGNNNYIFIKGGPHSASSGMANDTLYHTFYYSNLYDPTNNRQSNLQLDAENGITIEFWLLKNSFISGTESPKQEIFDVWNSQSFGSPSYGRLNLEVRPGVAGQTNKFYITLLSGTTGIFEIPIGQNLSLTGSEWNHYALSLINSNNNISGSLYYNGILNDSFSVSSSISLITGSMLGTIGSIIAPISGVYGALGWGKLSGSLDEFRFWKTRRTAQDIGQYWFTQVGAGTNSDTSNVDLGVYYKFNEGIIDTVKFNNTDTQVLDYSGRISNGTWFGYTVGSRNTGSAIVLAGAANSEFQDPILYPFHHAVSSSLFNLQTSGSSYDEQNNVWIYGSVPEWITSEDQNNGQLVLKKLTQTMASYFDTVHLQIKSLPDLKSVQYVSSSLKPFPFVNRFLASAGLIPSEIFQDANALEALASRDNFREYDLKFDEVKNKIYQNIYNNLVYIYKSKGTEKAFRNLIRCFGVDDELIKINLYADQVTYNFQDNFRYTSVPKKYVDFNNTDRFYASVYQNTSSDPLSKDYIAAPPDVAFIPMTVECEAIFPLKFAFDSPLFFNTPFLSSSIYGCHTANTSSNGDHTWINPDYANFQVFSVKTQLESQDVFFVLTGTSGSVIPQLVSPIFQDVYNNAKWNFAVRIYSQDYPFSPGVSGTINSKYIVEFVGINNILDVTENSFSVSGTISFNQGLQFMTSPKKFYVGAHRNNFTGSLLQYTDLQISSLRVWYDYLDDDIITNHAADAANFGTKNPDQNAYLTEISNSFGN